MDKREVEKCMPLADEAICEILKKEENISKANNELKIDKKYRSKLSAFGATVVMSGLLPAVAYYTKNEKTIIKLLEYMYAKANGRNAKEDFLFNEISGKENTEEIDEIKETIINYAISLKLVMNLYI